MALGNIKVWIYTSVLELLFPYEDGDYLTVYECEGEVGGGEWDRMRKCVKQRVGTK